MISDISDSDMRRPLLPALGLARGERVEEAEAIRPGRNAAPFGWRSPDPDTEREAPLPLGEVETRDVEDEAADIAD